MLSPMLIRRRRLRRNVRRWFGLPPWQSRAITLKLIEDGFEAVFKSGQTRVGW